MADPDIWAIVEADFPRLGSPADQLRFLLQYAVLAPSPRNVQPWHFQVQDTHLDLYLDPARALPVVDPQQRELIISGGAALAFLLLAIRHYGRAGQVDPWPDPARPDLLARVRLGPLRRPGADEDLLFQSIPYRHTNRFPFADRMVPPTLLVALRDLAAGEGAALHFVDSRAARQALAGLIAEADRQLWADPAFRAETTAWLHPPGGAHDDGIAGAALGRGDLFAYTGPFLLRTLDLGGEQAAHDRELALVAPTLAVLATAEDTPAAWLAAGQVLGRVLLRASAEGVAASFLNQPVEVPALRAQVAALLPTPGCPQVVLRLGYGQQVPPAPRRAPALGD